MKKFIAVILIILTLMFMVGCTTTTKYPTQWINAEWVSIDNLSYTLGGQTYYVNGSAKYRWISDGMMEIDVDNRDTYITDQSHVVIRNSSTQ